MWNLQPLPELFQVEITNYCSLECNFCPYPVHQRPKMHMPVEDFKHYAKYFYKGQRVGIYMLGEPLLHPAFYDIVQATLDVGAIPEISTNGLHFPRQEQRERLLTCGLGYINCDITRWKESERRMDVVINNVVALVKDAIRLPSITGQVAVQIVFHREHPQDFPEEIKVLAAGNPSRVRLTRKFLDTWGGQLDSLYDVTDVKPPEVRRECAEPWNRVSVLVNGDVVPCCRDAHGWTIYGNLQHQTLQEIWLGPVVTKIRETMLAHQWDALPEPCKSCREWHIPMDRRVVTETGE